MNIKEKQMISELNKAVEYLSKPTYCLLCGKKETSFCNSHIVPRFILKQITKDGKVSYGQALHDKSKDIIQTTKGLNNAFTFRLICNKCDKEKFTDYENPELLINYDNLNFTQKNKILTQISIKTHLAYINTKYKQFNMNNLVYTEQMMFLKKQGLITATELDLKEHFDYLYKLSKNNKKTNFPFEVIYNTTLNYKIDIATQSLISYIYDLNGKQRYNPKDLTSSIITRYFYLVVFPHKNKTQILFFIEKSSKSMVKDIIEQFNKLSDDEKLHFLFISLIIHSEYFFINPTIKDIILKDKKLKNLYQNTDKVGTYTYYKEIQNFREYNNYFLEKPND